MYCEYFSDYEHILTDTPYSQSVEVKYWARIVATDANRAIVIWKQPFSGWGGRVKFTKTKLTIRKITVQTRYVQIPPIAPIGLPPLTLLLSAK